MKLAEQMDPDSIGAISLKHAGMLEVRSNYRSALDYFQQLRSHSTPPGLAICSTCNVATRTERTDRSCHCFLAALHKWLSWKRACIKGGSRAMDKAIAMVRHLLPFEGRGREASQQSPPLSSREQRAPGGHPDRRQPGSGSAPARRQAPRPPPPNRCRGGTSPARPWLCCSRGDRGRDHKGPLKLPPPLLCIGLEGVNGVENIHHIERILKLRN